MFLSATHGMVVEVTVIMSLGFLVGLTGLHSLPYFYEYQLLSRTYFIYIYIYIYIIFRRTFDEGNTGLKAN